MRGSATIDDLPVELLTRIFELVQCSSLVILEKTPKHRAYPGSVFRLPKNRARLDCIARKIQCRTTVLQNPLLVPDGEIISFSYVLCALGEVRCQWRDIVRTIRSSLVIFLDRQGATPLDGLEAHLSKCPPDAPLDILVTRHDFDQEPDDAERCRENSLAAEVIKLLAPWIRRCRSFVFDVQHSSSLPNITKNFHGHALDLRILKLQCRIEDAEDQKSVKYTATPTNLEEEFTFPRLTTLALDGRTFYDVCRGPCWEAQVSHLSLDTFSISNFTAPGIFTVAALVTRISKIGYIRHLTLSGVVFESRRFDALFGQTTGIGMDNLTIINGNVEFVAEFLHSNWGRILCFLDVVGTPIQEMQITSAHHLRLRNIPPLSTPENIFNTFGGRRLDIINYTEFNDGHLENIGRCCKFLTRVYIKDCPNITVDGLKNMITVRNDRLSKNHWRLIECIKFTDEPSCESDRGNLIECDTKMDHDVETARTVYTFHCCPGTREPIDQIYVAGHPEQLSESDREWFKARLRRFHWG